MTKTGIVVALLAAAALACGKKAPAGHVVASASAAPPASAPPPASASAANQGPFEGEIVVAVKDEAGRKLPASITYDIKGDKVRYVPASTSLRAVGDLAAQHAYAIDDASKSYRDLDARSAADAGKAAAQPKIARTGKTEKIAGVDCEDWTIDTGDAKADVCAAKGIAFFDLAREPKPGDVEPSWAAALTREKAFPLRVVMHDKAGKEQFRVDATKIDRKKLDDALFALPTGFKKTDLDVKPASL